MAIKLKVQTENDVKLNASGSAGATFGVSDLVQVVQSNDYDDLVNKPRINGVELIGDKTTSDLGIEAGVTSWNGQTGDVVYTPPEVPVQSVNGRVGAVVLDAADVGALPSDTVIPDDANLVHKAGAETITGTKTFTNGVEISRPSSGAILKLSSSATDTNFILERTGGSQCVLESGAGVGLFGTKSNHPLQIRTNYANRMTIGTDGSVKLVTAPSASSNDTQVATTKWVKDRGYAQASAIPTKTSELTNDAAFVNAAQAANAAPVQSVNGQTGAVQLTIPTVPSNVSAFTNDAGYVNAAQAANAAPVQSVNGQTGAVTIEGEVFIAEYGVTSYADVLAAYNAGKAVFAKRNSEFYELGYYESGTKFEFYLTRLTLTKRISVASSGWNAGELILVSNDIKINDKRLSANITLDASDVDALPDTTTYAESKTVGGSATFANGIHYGRVDNTSTSTVYTATIPGITEYYDGLTIILYNGKVTSASGYTININGLGAYGTYSNMALGNENTPTSPTRDTTIFNINYAMILIFCSDIGGQGITGWICYRGYDANTNTIGYQLRTNSSTMPTADKFYRYRLLFTSADGSHWVPANTSTSTNATAARTVNQRPIDPFGEIVYYGTTTAIEANANVTAAQLWQQYTLTLGYSFNRTGAALVLPYPSPIYIKATPQSDGSAIIDDTTPYVFALPTAADGKIYIYLGRTYAATTIELIMRHPVYYIDANGRKRIWTGEAITI